MKVQRHDVIVVGAGPAGAAAAIASARAGARTLLIEQRARPGGAGLAGQHRFLCGLYGSAPTAAEDTLNSGFPQEVARLLAAGSTDPLPLRMGRVFVLPCSGERLADVLAALIGAEPNLTAACGCRMAAAELNGNRIAELTLESPAGASRATADTFIDATGCAAVAAAAGAPLLHSAGDAGSLAGCMIRVAGVKDTAEPLPLLVPLVLGRLANAGSIPDCLRHTTFTAVPSEGAGYLRLNLPAATPDREGVATRYAGIVCEALKQELPAFAGATLDRSLPLSVLDREGPGIEGEYVLSGADVVQGHKFGGGVRNAWPIELWTSPSGPRYEYPPEGDYYEIPDRCLLSRSCPNLLAAGRCVSATREAAASLRVMGTCFALGQAAAALATRGDSRGSGAAARA